MGSYSRSNNWETEQHKQPSFPLTHETKQQCKETRKVLFTDSYTAKVTVLNAVLVIILPFLIVHKKEKIMHCMIVQPLIILYFIVLQNRSTRTPILGWALTNNCVSQCRHRSRNVVVMLRWATVIVCISLSCVCTVIECTSFVAH